MASFLAEVRNGPPGAWVERVEPGPAGGFPEFDGFSIRF